MPIAQHLHLDVTGALDQLLQVDRASENAAAARAAAARASPSSVALATRRMPLPPPPAAAFTRTG